jgi:hypothetical protein
MKKPNVQELVYSKIYPKPRANDPNSFVQHIQRFLVPEVREEVQRYFGRIDCIEAQYPGLDYTYVPHRRRLATFAWHRRLFRVFDELRLTKDEILSLCTWEGTRAAKERYERESGTEIEITTMHGVAAAPEGHGPRVIFHRQRRTSHSGTLADVSNRAAGKRKAEGEEIYVEDETEEQSIGVHLNQQLIAAADARERGETVTTSPQFEQWMKEAIERNELDPHSILAAAAHVTSFPAAQSSSDTFNRLRSLGIPDVAESSTGTPVRRPSIRADLMIEEHLNRQDQQRSGMVRREVPPQQDVERHSESDHARLSNLVETLQSSTTRLEADNAAMLSYLTRQRTETAR